MRLLLDTVALDAARTDGDVLGANEVLMDAFYTDVRGDLAQWREDEGLPRRPDAGLPRQRLPAADRRRPHRWRTGRMELT